MQGHAKMRLDVLHKLRKKFEPQKVKPLTQKFKFAQCNILEISKIFQNWASHNFLNFYLIMMILDFLESPTCLLQSLF